MIESVAAVILGASGVAAFIVSELVRDLERADERLVEAQAAPVDLSAADVSERAL